MERIAGLFLTGAFAGALAFTLFIAAKKGWFSKRVYFTTIVETADGLHEGTVVQVSGIRAGSVTEIDLLSAAEVQLKFFVFEKFHGKIGSDSRVQMIRPFVIGEKVLDIGVGSEEAPLPALTQIDSQKSVDLMDLISGRTLGPLLGTFQSLAESLKTLGAAFADKKRTQAIIDVFDQMKPLFENLNAMSVEFTKVGKTANKKKRLEQILSGLSLVTKELKVALPAFRKEVPDMGAELGKIVKNLNVLTTEFQKLTPAINAIAPDLPKTSRRAVEALDETVVLLKALQKTFLLRGSVREVREQELRKPAQTD